MKHLKNLLIVIIISIFTFSCSDDLPVDNPYLGDYQNGYFITNEGPFGTGTGTLTFINDENEVVQNAYKTVNNEDLGNIVQSMTFYNDKAYIVINNSHKVIVANRYTMKKIAVIEGDAINNPRSFVAIGNKGYISNWGNSSIATDDFIAVINLDSNTVTKTIAVGEGPEEMVVSNHKIYVNLQGGYHQNNKVEIIDSTTDAVSTTLTVGDVPNSLVKDTNGAIWILCGGRPSYVTPETSGSLVKIENEEIISTFNFDGTTNHPNHLTLHANELLYNLNGKVYTMANSATELSTTSLDGLDGFYYAMHAHNNNLYVTTNPYTEEGTLKVFDLSTNTENFTTTVGLNPGSIVFQ